MFNLVHYLRSRAKAMCILSVDVLLRKVSRFLVFKCLSQLLQLSQECRDVLVFLFDLTPQTLVLLLLQFEIVPKGVSFVLQVVLL